MIYPDQFPIDEREFDENPERLVYEALHGIADDYDVFYSQRFTAARAGEKEHYEVDFIIIHPAKGCLLLEVKGGLIEYDRAAGTWTQNGRKMQRSPVAQVLGYRKSLATRYPLLSAKLPIGWALCFPQCERDEHAALPTELTPETVLDERDLPCLEKQIVKLFAALRRKLPNYPGLSRDEYRPIREELLRGLGMTVRLGTRIERERPQWFRLTARQFEVLRLSLDSERTVVRGCAGSGKTVIATMLAKECLNRNRRVLFLCFNKPLAEQIGSEFAGADTRRLTCGAFFTFARTAINDEAWWEAQKHDTEFYDLQVPVRLEEVKVKAADRFDTVIIDEGQDFRAAWYEMLERWLKPEGQMVVFLDPRQDQFRHFTRLPKERSYQKHTLTHNCRNGLAIAEYLRRETGAEFMVYEDPPQGKLRLRQYRRPADQLKMLENDIGTLLKGDALKPHQIVILIQSDKRESVLDGVKKIAGCELTSSYHPAECRPQQIRYAQISVFKGLEADVVILTDTHLLSATEREQCLYLEASRAQQLLIVYRQS